MSLYRYTFILWGLVSLVMPKHTHGPHSRHAFCTHHGLDLDPDLDNGDLSSVYTNAVSFETASKTMRLRLLFTRHRSRPLPKPGRFENAAKSGAFSKRYGFI